MRKLTNEELTKVKELLNMKENDWMRELVNGMLSGGIDWDIVMYKVATKTNIISE